MRVLAIFMVTLTTINAQIDQSFSPYHALLTRDNPTSVDGNCGSNSATNATCLLSEFGNCCSGKGYCGKTADYCEGECQSGFGTCNTASGKQSVSTSGSCGATQTSNITCQGSEFGNCCSRLGFCGKNSSYCGTGCQSGFGSCGETGGSPSTSLPVSLPVSTSTAISTSSSPSSTQPAGAVSVDGNCGSNSAIGATCLGSEFGDCCSSLGYCGGNSSYCDTGCQSTFGSCTSSNSAASNTTLSNTTNSTNGTNHSSSPPDSVLSTGGKAGVGIAAGVIALAAFGLLLWYVRRRRRNRRALSELPGRTPTDFESPLQISPVAKPEKPPTVEMATTIPASEMDGAGRQWPADATEMAAAGENRELQQAWVQDRANAGYNGYRRN